MPEAERKAYTRNANLKTKFGITLTEWNKLFDVQNEQCAVCKTTNPGDYNGWCVDHCHSTDSVRGILCRHCNLLLGYARDNIGVLANAISYLQNPPANAVLH